MLAYFAVLSVVKTYTNFQRSCVCGIPLLALFNRVLHIIFAQSKVHKFQAELSTIILDRRDVIKNFLHSFIKKPLVGILLNLNEVRHFKYLFLSGITHTEAFVTLHWTYSVFLH